MIIEKIKREIKPGDKIPLPSGKNYEVIGWSERTEEDTLMYLIRKHENTKKQSRKGITASEFRKAYQKLNEDGSFDRKWYKRCFPKLNYDRPCNFSAIGGIFRLLGIAYYQELGIYTKQNLLNTIN